MNSGKPTFLIVAKEKPGLAESIAYLRERADVELIVGDRNSPVPERVLKFEGDFLVSYISPWIIPKAALVRPRVAALNFHPGPPEYPGTGCTNFALYELAKEFGVTAHHMLAAVDTGAIISVRRFPIFKEDDVHSLTMRCYEHIGKQFREVLGHYFEHGRLPQTSERWKRRPFRRAELNELCRITPDMDDIEVKRRVRATLYPGMPGPFIELAGYRFELRVPC